MFLKLLILIIVFNNTSFSTDSGKRKLEEDECHALSENKRQHLVLQNAINNESLIKFLPSEILLKVFSFVEDKDLFSLQIVSKRTKYLIEDKSLWQELAKDDNYVDDPKSPPVTNSKTYLLHLPFERLIEIAKRHTSYSIIPLEMAWGIIYCKNIRTFIDNDYNDDNDPLDIKLLENIEATVSTAIGRTITLDSCEPISQTGMFYRLGVDKKSKLKFCYSDFPIQVHYYLEYDGSVVSNPPAGYGIIKIRELDPDDSETPNGWNDNYFKLNTIFKHSPITIDSLKNGTIINSDYNSNNERTVILANIEACFGNYSSPLSEQETVENHLDTAVVNVNLNTLKNMI